MNENDDIAETLNSGLERSLTANNRELIYMFLKHGVGIEASHRFWWKGCQNDYPEVVQFLLTHDLKQFDTKYFIAACQSLSLQVIKVFMRSELDLPYSEGLETVFSQKKRKKFDIAEEIVRKGYRQGLDFFTPKSFYEACRSENLNLVSLMLGECKNTPATKYHQAFLEICRSGNVKALNKLFERKGTCWSWNTGLMCACEKKGRTEMVKLLLKLCPDLTWCLKTYNYACQNNYIDAVEQLLKCRNVNLNAITEVIPIVNKYIIKDLTGLISKFYIQNEMSNVLQFGCWDIFYYQSWSINRDEINILWRGQYRSIFKYLLTKGVCNWKIVMTKSIEDNNMKMVKLAIRRGGAKINITDAFLTACRWGRLRIMKFLYNKYLPSLGGANIVSGFEKGCKYGHLKIVKFLYPKISGYERQWGESYACKGGHLNIVKYLVEHGSRVYLRYRQSNTYGYDQEIRDYLEGIKNERERNRN